MYLTTEEAANAAMSHILNGKVGFDTEYTKRRPTDEEALIEETFPNGGASRKSAMLGWQIVELRAGAFTINWDKIGLRLIQIAHNDEVFVLDMWKIRAFPTELVRILSDPNIKKAGVALTNELTVFWDDFRFELVNLVDVGLMAKLVLCEKYQNTSYSNLSLKVSVEEILGYTITKDLQKSDWTKDNLDRDQIIYAATDAVASLLLHDALSIEMEIKGNEIGTKVPQAWYTFNTRFGEPVRTKLSFTGSEVQWKLSDCTWFAGGKFVGYPDLD
ncbi:ribonuclease H-like domain-containing protein [Mycena maculata]|uniref:3'-5' exonuclease n=1 Tax=Mycena maculata TaxID=230809 RepID=A0AAD7J9U2_9AGAR|nr:ribonuclease H-like domain-containing protein [Mycena maculata]